MVGIYKIQNKINGKVYIGQTKEVERRFRQHLRSLRSNSHFNPHLQRAWNSYGEENFSFDLVDDFTEQLSDADPNTMEKVLDKAEKLWISYYKATDEKHGYNLSTGGDGATLLGPYNGMFGRNHSESSKKLMSQHRRGKCQGKDNPRYGKKLSEATKKKISLANRGRTPSEETRRKMSESAKKQPHLPHSIETRQKISRKNTGKKWYTDGIKNVVAYTCPDGFYLGKAPSENRSLKWFNNGKKCVRSKTCPEGFVPGRLYRREDD